MERKVAPKLKTTETKRIETLQTVSSQIRYLASEGYTRADIGRILNKRYQHVKNVLDNPLKG